MDNLQFQARLEKLLEKEYSEKVETLITRTGMSTSEIAELQGELRQIRHVGALCKDIAKQMYGA